MQLSSALTEITTIRKLARVLQMDMSTVDVLITKLYKDTGLAAYSVFQEWLKGQVKSESCLHQHMQSS